MGYDIDRFKGDVDEELICAICAGVLEDPLQVPDCEHAFCTECITEWLKRKSTCPIDRRAVTASQCRPVPRILRNLLSRLSISCDNAAHGCSAEIKLDSLASHLTKCDFNPKKPTPCEEGCGVVIPKDQIEHHSCAYELRCLIDTNDDILNEYEVDLAEMRQVITRQNRELKHLDVLVNCKILGMFFLQLLIFVIFIFFMMLRNKS